MIFTRRTYITKKIKIMQAVVTQNLRSISIPDKEFVTAYSGILKSNYKLVIEKDRPNLPSKSLCGIRCRLKNMVTDMGSYTATMLKISVFVIFAFAVL